MSLSMPSAHPFTHISAFTHQGDISLDGLNIASKLQTRTNGGIITGDITVNSDHKISITSEWSEVFVAFLPFINANKTCTGLLK